jgi:hypothetical protein
VQPVATIRSFGLRKSRSADRALDSTRRRIHQQKESGNDSAETHSFLVVFRDGFKRVQQPRHVDRRLQPSASSPSMRCGVDRWIRLSFSRLVPLSLVLQKACQLSRIPILATADCSSLGSSKVALQRNVPTYSCWHALLLLD